jgi:hypothetical protein
MHFDLASIAWVPASNWEIAIGAEKRAGFTDKRVWMGDFTLQKDYR